MATCPRCNRFFKVLPDEDPADFGCPKCGYDPWDEIVIDDNVCPNCGEGLVIEHDDNYGADRDGNRGIPVTEVYCRNGCDISDIPFV